MSVPLWRIILLLIEKKESTWQRVEMAPGRLFLSRTSATHLGNWMAVQQRSPTWWWRWRWGGWSGLLSTPLCCRKTLPGPSSSRRRPRGSWKQWLYLEFISLSKAGTRLDPPITPRGFQFSIKAWPGLSLGITFVWDFNLEYLGSHPPSRWTSSTGRRHSRRCRRTPAPLRSPPARSSPSRGWPACPGVPTSV